MLQSPSFVFGCWLCLVAFVGLTRVYEVAPPQAVGITIASGTLFLLTLARFNRRFGEHLDAISTERLICWHAIRAPIGAAFLVLAGEGLLPSLFATRAGYGDMLTACFGLLAVAVFSSTEKSMNKTRAYIAWNVLGLCDLMLAVGTGISLALKSQDSMIWITRLPLLLIPGFILPVLFASHFIMLKRLLSRTEVVDGPNHDRRVD